MELNNLTPAKGSVKKRKRVGRGQGSGKGGTSTRGHKGAKSRSGYSRKIGFEGGQMPLQRRVPKFGFRNINRVSYQGINVDALETIAEKLSTKDISLEMLISNGIVSKNDKVKILGRGEIGVAINIEAHAISKGAKALLEAAGGSFKEIA